jgi:hypothetical protein
VAFRYCGVPALFAVTILLSGCATAARHLDGAFAEGCWTSPIGGERFSFVREAGGSLHGTIATSEGDALIELDLSPDRQSVLVTTYPSTPFVSAELSVRLPRKLNDAASGHGLSDPGALSFSSGDGNLSVWLDPHDRKTGARVLYIYAASIAGWKTDPPMYEHEAIFAVDPTPCN